MRWDHRQASVTRRRRPLTSTLPETLSRSELGDAAATLRRLLDAVSRGDLDAPAITIRDLEASMRTLEAVAQMLKPDDE
jgi:hypothetical protein